MRCGECRGGSWGVQEICNSGCGILSRTRSLQGRMAQELSEKELLRMEVEQLKKEVRNPRAPVSLLFPFSSLPVPHGAGQEKQWGGGPLQGTRRSRRYLWDGVGCGRRLGFDPTEVHRRQPLHLPSSACPALSRPGPGPVSLAGKNQTLGSGQGTHTPLTPACPFRHSPLWPLPPPCPEACFLGTNQVMAPKQQTRAGTRLYFFTDF